MDEVVQTDTKLSSFTQDTIKTFGEISLNLHIAGKIVDPIFFI